MRSKMIVRAGLVSAPVTAFAPAAGTALTGHGALWLALPLGSVAAAVAGTRADRRAASTRRRGVVVDDPDLNELRETLTAPRDLITVEFAWSDEATR